MFLGDFQYTMIVVFSMNQDPSLWEQNWVLAAGISCQTQPIYGGGHTHRMRLLANEYTRTIDLKVNKATNLARYGGGGRTPQAETWGYILGIPDGSK